MKRKPKSDAAIRKALKAGPHDVIDHLLVDAPPCAPEEEPEIETTPRSDAANAMLLMLKHCTGAVALDFGEVNVRAIVEIGGEVAIDPHFPARANLLACYRPDPASFKQIVAYHWDVYYVEPREAAESNAKRFPAAYAGWNEPPPPELTAEQAAAIAADLAFQVKEATMVALAERELAAEAAAKACAPKKEAA